MALTEDEKLLVLENFISAECAHMGVKHDAVAAVARHLLYGKNYVWSADGRFIKEFALAELTELRLHPTTARHFVDLEKPDADLGEEPAPAKRQIHGMDADVFNKLRPEERIRLENKAQHDRAEAEKKIHDGMAVKIQVPDWWDGASYQLKMQWLEKNGNPQGGHRVTGQH
jgi:hypothetical protein